jgi:hypothetical protein
MVAEIIFGNHKSVISRKVKSISLVAVFAALIGGSLMAYDLDPITNTAMKRLFVAKMDQKCAYFTPEAAMALKAGFVQTRNEALRSGHSMADLSYFLTQARSAADTANCASAPIQAEAQNVRDSYTKFVTQARLSLPGERARWEASRSNEKALDWRMVQYQSGPKGDVAMGLYGPLAAPSLVVMARFSDAKRPVSARLLLRNPNVAATGLINRAAFDISPNRPFGSSDVSDLSFNARAISETQIYLKPHVKTNDFGMSLTGDYIGKQSPETAMRFDFPTRAFVAIAALDPREDIVVAFDFDDGPRYVRFEVGDFITGLAYVALPSPYGERLF